MKYVAIAVTALASVLVIAQNLEPTEPAPPFGAGAGGVAPVVWPVRVVENGPIENQLLDLLDSDLTLLPGEGWTSAVFDTSQSNRIGIRVIGVTSSMGCDVSWDWGDGGFAPEGPGVVALSGAARATFGDIRGPQARVRCFNSVAVPVTTSDVKIWLRRE